MWCNSYNELLETDLSIKNAKPKKAPLVGNDRSPPPGQTKKGCNMYRHENNQVSLEIEIILRNDVDEQIFDSD